MKKYTHREQAGKLLAEKLETYANRPDTMVLALPRGGVPVAYEIAKALHLPLDVFIVRKLGCPWHEELALGAIASGGSVYLNTLLIKQLGISQAELDAVLNQEKQELQRRELRYRGDREFPDLTGKIVILVDDGIATGATMLAAIAAIKRQQPQQLIVAAPVAAADTCEMLANQVDDLVCPLQPNDFYAVGYWYEVFRQTQDEEVIALLNESR